MTDPRLEPDAYIKSREPVEGKIAFYRVARLESKPDGSRLWVEETINPIVDPETGEEYYKQRWLAVASVLDGYDLVQAAPLVETEVAS